MKTKRVREQHKGIQSRTVCLGESGKSEDFREKL
jgi:hypothetical protein